MPSQQELPSIRTSSRKTHLATSVVGAGALMLGATALLDSASAQSLADCNIDVVAKAPAPVSKATELILAKQLPGGTKARNELASGKIPVGEKETRILGQRPGSETTINSRGQRVISGVEIYNPNLTDPNVSSAYMMVGDVLCNVQMVLPLYPVNVSPAVTRGVPAATPNRTIGAPVATSRETPQTIVVTATSTPTARVETATPTATVKEVIREVTKEVTPTPTTTPYVVTATPGPETPTPTPNPISSSPAYRFWEGATCVGLPLAAVILGGALVYASRRENGSSSGGSRDYDELIRGRRLLDNLRYELATNGNIRNWALHEQNSIYAVNVTSAAAPLTTKDSAGDYLSRVSGLKNFLNPDQRRLLDAVRDFREQTAGIQPDAKAVVDTKRVSDETRQLAITDFTKRVNAFDTTKAAEDARRAFVVTNPDHPLTTFDAETAAALAVTGRERVWERRGILPWRTYRYY